ncbi:mitochondrial import inner membrane translocase subunit Tim10 B-like [Myxocyprinus asiaticus]|uniref:mitochondrial import inner membrane translocase subunit Tim10 B-like n=1 Tax=Myxocyprinus asiaticus TaxID=70543 RepID=UPI00222182D5|nr:mitochondrial import inner membrane translocase subunit Tim10 B-like [Myxocyprinus asiaticus]
MDPDGQLRNLRDFLLVYNRMTEICFQRCTSNFNYRNLTMDEESCVDNCAGKLIRTNHRLMGTYVQLMPAMVQKRMQEMESKAAEVAKAEAAVQEGASALESPSAVLTDTLPLSASVLEIPATSSPVMEMPSSKADHVPTSGLETPRVPSAHNDPSEIKTAAKNGSGFGGTPLILEPATQATETAKLPVPSLSTSEASLLAVSAVTNNTQSFTSESLEGLVTAPPAISTSSSSNVPSPKVDAGSVSSAVAAIPVEKLDLKPSSVTAAVPETRSTRQNSQTLP